jgi:multidrug efflux pump subunit AcrA (membrane-fusion protein)
MASSVTDQVASAAIQGPETEQPWTVKHRSALLVSSASLLIVVLLAMMSNFRSPSPKTALTRQNHGVLVSDRIRVSGSTEAVRMRTIVAPMLQGQQFGTLTITKLVTSGTHVGKGDLLVDFDRQAQMRNFVDKQDEYQKLANQVIQEQAKDDAARAKDETEIQQAESNLSKAQLEMQKRELLSRIDAEKAQQTLEEAKATLQQLRATFDLKRKSAHSAVRLLEIQRDRAQEVMEHARSNTELMQIKSPIDGVVVLNTIWKQGKMGQVQEGDQVRAGVSFMQVVDPSSMQVRAFVNQEDFLALQFGDTAQIHLDAYPELVFPGKLVEMAPIARNGDFSDKLRSFAVVFSITGADAKLMPDLSAAVDVNLSMQASGAVAFHPARDRKSAHRW